jgi:iron complex outermembrane receptor protein
LNFNYEVLDQFTGERFEIDISSPPQGFHLIHFYSELTLKMNKRTNLNIGLGVNNVFNTSYRNYLNSLRYFADELGRNIILQLKLNY